MTTAVSTTSVEALAFKEWRIGVNHFASRTLALVVNPGTYDFSLAGILRV